MTTLMDQARQGLTAEQKHAQRVQQEADLLRARRDAKRLLDTEERAPVPPPEFLTLRERLMLPRAPLNWRIEKLLCAGHRGLLAAQNKAGKTTLVCNLVRSLLDGSPFLDTYEVAAIGGTVALFDFEMSARQLDDWYRDLGIQNDDRLLSLPMRGAASSFNILDPSIRTQWAERLRAHRVQFLIIDCLRPALDALGLAAARPRCPAWGQPRPSGCPPADSAPDSAPRGHLKNVE